MEIVVVILLIAAAVGVTIAPLLRRDAGAPDPVRSGGASSEGLAMADIDREVGRYREALRAGTVCRRCLQANPPGSRFCSECGRALAGTAARTTDASVVSVS